MHPVPCRHIVSPLEYIDHHRSGGPFHRLHTDSDRGGYGSAHLSRRVEVHDRVDDLVTHGLSGSDEDGQAVQCRIDKKGITLRVLATSKIDVCKRQWGLKYLDSSWKTDRSRSSNPEASASKFGRDKIAWFRGTMAKDVSFWSGR